MLAVRTPIPEEPHNFKVIVNTDNAALQQVLEAGRGRDAILCACARQLWLLSALTNFELCIKHKPERDLVLADALSRRHNSVEMDKKWAELGRNLSLEEVFPVLSLDILDFEL